MPRRHLVLALVVAVCWAVNFVVIDIGLESFPPLLFAALRFGLTAFPAISFVPRPDVRWRAVVAVGLFIGVGQFGVLFVAMNTGLPAGLASVIAPLQPVFTIPFAVIALGERPSLRQVIGVSLAIAGLGAIAVGRARGVPLQAVALGVASAASWGCGNVVTRAARPKRPFSLLVWSSVVAPLPLLGLSLIFEGTGRWQSAVSSVGASGLAEAIVTRDIRRARRFTQQVDAAAVLVNASTRLVDGSAFGMGAEMGISTSRVHARGPVGVRELTTTKFVVQGDGQVRD